MPKERDNGAGLDISFLMKSPDPEVGNLWVAQMLDCSAKCSARTFIKEYGIAAEISEEHNCQMRYENFKDSLGTRFRKIVE